MMDGKESRRYGLFLMPVILLTLFLLAGCAEKEDEIDMTKQGQSTVATVGKEAEYTEFSDLSGKTVSMLTGAPFEELARSKNDNIAEFTFFNSTPDMLLALEAGKTDAVLINNAIAALAANRSEKLAVFPKNLQDGVFGIAFRKNDPVRDEWQKAYDLITEEEKQALWEKWTGSDESAKILPEQSWPGKNGTIQAAVCDTLEPMSYAGEGGKLMGFDVEMILLMAEKLDVHVEFTGMEFSAILATVQSGKATLGAGSIIVTNERRELVDFVEYYPAAFVLIVRSKQIATSAQMAGAVQSPEDVRGKKIGVLTGTNIGEIINETLPESEVLYFNTMADEISALKSGKVAAVALDEPVARMIQAQDGELTIIPKLLDSLEYGFVLGKDENGEALRDELSEFILQHKADGSLEELQKKWFDCVDPSTAEMTDYRDLPAERGTIRLGIFQYPPFTLKNEELFCGYEVDLISMFCRDHGYGLQIIDLSPEGVLASVQSGKSDIAACGISITEERKEKMLFSESNYAGGTALLVLKQTKTNESVENVWTKVSDSFERTFMRENRWRLFLQGIGTTLLITTLSILFGTILGFFVFMICRNGNPVANSVTRFFIWLVRGMPVVVLLMILYYIIFGKVSISGTAVSVIAFTLVFGSGVYGMIKAGVAAVDRGQLEAAYALGYTNRQAFYRIILPQALPHFMPAYKSSITDIIKATAIVGYVAVQDLTKMGDIVRSRTLEAFFPLIAVAVIYFILAAVLTLIVKRIEICIDPKHRSMDSIRKEVEES